MPDLDEKLPDIGFSVEELQYLLSVAPGESGATSGEMLNVGPVPPVDETLLVGGAALLARGQLVLDDDGRFAPVDAALVVAFILTTATRWTSITGATEDTADTGAYIESPSGGLLAQPRTLGTWWFVFLDPAAPPAEILVETVMGLIGEAKTSGALARTITADDDRSFSVRRTGDGWAHAYGATGSEMPDLISMQSTREQVSLDLAAFIARFPAAP